MNNILYFTPNFFKIIPIKHQLVNADCKRLAPTNAVNHNQFGLMKCANNKLIKIKLPAIALIYLFIILKVFSYIIIYSCCLFETGYYPSF